MPFEYPEEVKAAALEMVDDGHSYLEIAEQLEITVGTISTWVRATKVDVKKAKPYIETDPRTGSVVRR